MFTKAHIFSLNEPLERHIKSDLHKDAITHASEHKCIKGLCLLDYTEQQITMPTTF